MHANESSNIKDIMILYKTHWLYSSQDPHQDIKVLLARYESNPESEAQLKLLLPQIVSTFGGNKSVTEIIEELKKHQSSTDPNGTLIDIFMVLYWNVQILFLCILITMFEITLIASLVVVTFLHFFYF